ncbi:YmdB family metallophosphoesterase [Candidatus Parcubacteria bacterium]|nr:YmdB family metallophosphoesterase [Candidatus Parcubacteria bacterium]
MRILFLGDIVGKLGRRACEKLLPKLKKDAKIDLVLANAENIAHGKGATKATIEEVLSYGIDHFTSGNHIFWCKGFDRDIEGLPVLRPANYPPETPGKGYTVLDLGKSGQVLLINLLGRTFIESSAACPFREADRILEEFQGREGVTVVVDIHGEATSEKVALGWYLDGRVAAVLGTHTHVPTADAWVMPKGTAYITDVGMVGARNSVLGVAPPIIIDRFITAVPQRFDWVENGPAVFNSVLLEVDGNGRAKSIERIDRVLAG